MLHSSQFLVQRHRPLQFPLLCLQLSPSITDPPQSSLSFRGFSSASPNFSIPYVLLFPYTQSNLPSHVLYVIPPHPSIPKPFASSHWPVPPKSLFSKKTTLSSYWPIRQFCPLLFSALFSASDTQHPNPFHSISLEPFPLDPTHNTLFTFAHCRK